MLATYSNTVLSIDVEWEVFTCFLPTAVTDADSCTVFVAFVIEIYRAL